jgi:hypothetical protein
MSGVLTLSGGDLVILRDISSQFYLQAGQDTDPTAAVAKLVSGNLTALQPSVYFQVHSTPINGFWTITTVANAQYLKVDTSATGNQNKLTWVSTNPSNELVVDKSPYYFSFTQVAGFDSPVLYVLGTYYNGGMTLQQPGGPGTDLIFGMPQAIAGTQPEVSFEVTVPSGPPAGIGAQALELLDLATPTGGGSSSGVTPSTAPPVDGWAVAFIVLIAFLAVVALAYGFFMMVKFYNYSNVRQADRPPQKTDNPDAPATNDNDNDNEETEKEKAKTSETKPPESTPSSTKATEDKSGGGEVENDWSSEASVSSPYNLPSPYVLADASSGSGTFGLGL